MPAGSSVGMVGLQARAESSGQANRGAKARHDPNFACDQDQVLQAHQLVNGRRHLRCEAGRERGQPLRRCFVGEQPVAEFAYRETPHRREDRGVMRIQDQPRDFVLLVRDHRLAEKHAPAANRQAHIALPPALRPRQRQRLPTRRRCAGV